MKRTLTVAAVSLAVQGIMAAGVTRFAEPQNRPVSQGRFTFSVPRDPGDATEFLLRIDLLRQTADALNRDIRLPTTVLITVNKCSKVNASYQVAQGRRVISICVGLVDEAALWALQRMLSTDTFWVHHPAWELTRAEDEAKGVLQFLVLHEVGHALIDVFKLPVLGREEDAADEFAVWYGIHAHLNLDGVGDWLPHLATTTDSGTIEITPEEAGESHTTPTQRGYLEQCLVLGELYGRGVLDSTVDVAVPGRTWHECRDEWRRVSSTWTSLLRSHLRQADDWSDVPVPRRQPPSP